MIAALAAALIALPAGQGRAVVRCDVTPAHAVRRCVVVSEAPAGANVGAFALQLVRGYRVHPSDRRVRNGKIVLQLKFKLPARSR